MLLPRWDNFTSAYDLYTVGSDLLTRRIGDVDPHTQEAVDRALRLGLGLVA